MATVVARRRIGPLAGGLLVGIAASVAVLITVLDLGRREDHARPGPGHPVREPAGHFRRIHELVECGGVRCLRRYRSAPLWGGAVETAEKRTDRVEGSPIRSVHRCRPQAYRRCTSFCLGSSSYVREEVITGSSSPTTFPGAAGKGVMSPCNSDRY